MRADPPKKLLLLCPSCFHFLKQFSLPFIFWAKKKLRGPICSFLPVPLFPEGPSYSCSCAHTFHSRPPKRLGWQWRSGTEVNITPHPQQHCKMLEEEAACSKMVSSAFWGEHPTQKQIFPLKVWGLFLRGLATTTMLWFWQKPSSENRNSVGGVAHLVESPPKGRKHRILSPRSGYRINLAWCLHTYNHNSWGVETGR